MSNLKFMKDGRELPLSEFGNELKKSLRQATADATIERIEALRCPVHNVGPKNVQMTIEGGKVRWTFVQCCEVLERAAAAAMK